MLLLYSPKVAVLSSGRACTNAAPSNTNERVFLVGHLVICITTGHMWCLLVEVSYE